LIGTISIILNYFEVVKEKLNRELFMLLWVGLKSKYKHESGIKENSMLTSEQRR